MAAFSHRLSSLPHAYTSAALVCGWVESHNDTRTRMLPARVIKNMYQIDFLMPNKAPNLPASKIGQRVNAQSTAYRALVQPVTPALGHRNLD